jgi:hypothetical protein
LSFCTRLLLEVAADERFELRLGHAVVIARADESRAGIVELSLRGEQIEQCRCAELVTALLNAEVFRFAAWQGDETADWMLPAPGFLEGLTDVPTAPGVAIETYAVAAPLVAPTPGTRDAASFLASLDATAGSVEDGIKARCARIFQAREGELRGGEATPLSAVESAEALHKELVAGAVWAGQPAEPEGLTCQLREWPAPTVAERSNARLRVAVAVAVKVAVGAVAAVAVRTAAAKPALAARHAAACAAAASGRPTARPPPPPPPPP